MKYGYGFECGWAGGTTLVWLLASAYAALGFSWAAFLAMALLSFVLGVINVRDEANRGEA